MIQGIGAPQPSGHPDAPNPDEQINEDGSAQPTPEEQAAYDKFVNAAIDMTMDGGQQSSIKPQIVEDLKGNFDPQIAQMFQNVQPALTQSPIDSLAATAVIVVMLTEATLSQQGAPVDHEIVYHAGTEIVSHLAEVAEAAGVHKFEQQEVDSAFLRGLDIYRQASPNVDQDALKQEFGQLVEADKEGKLDSVLPGIGKVAQQAQSS